MLRVEESVLINRAPADVFAFLENTGNDVKWSATTVESGFLDPGDNRVGRRGRTVGRFLGRRIELIWEITAYDPPKQIEYRVVEGPLENESVYRVEAEGDGCRFTFALEFPRGHRGLFGKLADPLFVRMLGRQARADLDNLRDILEAGSEAEL
jgi:hypothetical protein